VVARSSIDLDELVEHWTVLDDEQALVDAKHGGLRLGFALLLKHYTRYGRFPTGVAELPDAAIEFVARQLQVPALDVGTYEWTGRSIERHRAQIREHLGFRECTVTDAEQLTAWLAEHVAERERRPEQVRNELLVRCRSERVEPPAQRGLSGRAIGAARQRGGALVAGHGPPQRRVQTVDRTPGRCGRRRARGRTGGQKPKLTPRQAKIAQEMYDQLDAAGRRAYTVRQGSIESSCGNPG
jgi:hypothetical protein